ncbi:MAG: PfkB family carbohydrate kinase [Thermomicrobiales bacterium]
MVVVCLGEALIDLVPLFGESARTTATLTVQPGGAPLNVSVGLARLDCESLFLGCLSEDSFGLRLREVLEREHVRRVPSDPVLNPTRLAVVDHTNAIAPFRFYGDTPADSRLLGAHIDDAFRSDRITGLYVGSLMMTNESGESAQRYAIQRAAELAVPIYADPNPRPSAWPSQEDMIAVTEYLLTSSSLAKLSIDDATVLGWPVDPMELIGWCEDRFGTQIFVTGGAAGCWANVDGRIAHIQPPEIVAVDPTGAGDASFSALITSVQQVGQLSEEGLRFASAAGAITTLTRGAIAAFPSLDQIESFLAEWG